MKQFFGFGFFFFIVVCLPKYELQGEDIVPTHPTGPVCTDVPHEAYDWTLR